MTREETTAALARDTAAVVLLLERFGGLLAEALDAAGRGAEDDFAVAVAERGRVTVALRNRLAALAAARQVAQRDGVRASEIAGVLDPVSRALCHAQLLHDRVADSPDRVASELEFPTMRALGRRGFDFPTRE